MAEVASGRWVMEMADEAATFDCPAGLTLLKAMIAAGKTCITVGCRSGGCGVCRVRVSKGVYESQKMARARISEADEAAGIVLACRILPKSNLTVEPFPLELRGVMT